MAQNWIPVLNALSYAAGVRLKFVTAKDIPSFEACLAKGAYDLAYMNPYHYVTVHDSARYAAFARERARLQGIITMRKSAPLTSLNDLQGATVAFPSPAAFAASVIPRAELRKLGIDFTPSYVKSHDSVYRAVHAGLFPAGGGVVRTFDNMPDEIKSGLKIVFKTPPYSPHAFAARPAVDPRLVQRVATALTGLVDPRLLKPIGMTSGFEAAADGDWDDIRALRLTATDTGISQTASAACLSG